MDAIPHESQNFEHGSKQPRNNLETSKQPRNILETSKHPRNIFFFFISVPPVCFQIENKAKQEKGRKRKEKEKEKRKEKRTFKRIDLWTVNKKGKKEMNPNLIA